MHNTLIITNPEQLEEIVLKAISQALKPLNFQANQGKPNKKWLTGKEVQELLNCSTRSLQHLRDSRQIEFSQHARKIMYPADGIEKFLSHNIVKSRGKR
jgi:hypothetical protein